MKAVVRQSINTHIFYLNAMDKEWEDDVDDGDDGDPDGNCFDGKNKILMKDDLFRQK